MWFPCMRSALAGSYVHMANIDVGFAQDRADAPDHTWFIGVAAEEDVALGYEFCPIATYSNDTWLIMHHRSTYHLHILVSSAGFARVGSSIAIDIQEAYSYVIVKLCWHRRFLFNYIQLPLLCYQWRINNVDMRI